ncbi:hypothetical protein GGI25_003854 [Coemansia spiralis]|uniref:4'-phosphopantetheinyl transferase domain-containing protein n=2 Tax=Coemansia TaxID=4863 RepID=A0A9W8G6I0_9FUNG|nr:4'-phosphopantetheinyl transferase superfamily [Coemansia spiralis]KAJ1991001.1 hypothetical protein EDC05_003721 [Coemansia umbellata]KAJ2621011.1 hypothetical protein GGI26_004511 [Coemansia sp. RSA 1358]KAJ2675760.1 hypothetical protein GGI25_003854 [Coemansia spiralis]
MIIGIGVDILATDRIARIVRRGSSYATRFARHILCDCEIGYFTNTLVSKNENEQIRYLATRWCLKEAVYKAAYPHQILRWSDVSIYKVGPKLAMNVRWNQELQGAFVHASISHDGGLIAGYVVIEKNEEAKRVK